MNENGERPLIEPSVPPRRDDTPSFIRNVESTKELLEPVAGEHQSLIPVMEMPRNIRIWRMVRWPLFGLGVLMTLAIFGVTVNDALVSRNIAERIEEARKIESIGSVETVVTAGKALSGLAAKYPDRKNVQAAWAWQAVLEATWFGPQEHLADKAKKAIEAAEVTDPSVIAARVGLACLYDNPEFDSTTLTAVAGKHPDPRLLLARAWLETAQGETSKALSTIEFAIKEHPSYVPLMVEGMRTAFLMGDRAQTAKWIDRLRKVSPDHLWANLVLLASSLPNWGQDPFLPDAGRSSLATLKKLAARIEEAPPRLRAFGRQLEGRALLAAGEISAAEGVLAKTVEDAPSPELLAWHALAVMKLDGPMAAIAALKQGKGLSGPWVLDIQAQALLALHQVEDARPIIEQLVKSGDLSERTGILGFVLAVREGSIDTALERLPGQLSPEVLWPTLELYEQAATEGNRKAVSETITAIAKLDEGCGEALRAWHGKSDREALRTFQRYSASSVCAAALRARLLLGRDDPRRLLDSANRAMEACKRELWCQMNQALATYLVNGQEEALALLNQVAAVQPQGSPLRVALGRAYLRVFDKEKALAMVQDDKSDAALALRIDASNETEIDELIAQAATRYSASPTPALAYFAALQLQREEKHSEAAALAAAAAPKSGTYGPRIGALAARSLSAVRNNSEADRVLEELVTGLRRPAGYGASWDARNELVMFNLRRGGKNTFRAISLIGEVTSQNVRSADHLYAFAMAILSQGNERGSPRFLREALLLDPSHAQACKQLHIMGKLEADVRAACLKTRPDLQL
jgi:hypothetical protein